MPLVSVIVPNYNHAPFLDKRINSVLNQSFQNFELIILDDASTDESRSIIERYREHPRVSRILINAKNSGSIFGQWRKGIEISKSDWIWIAESDDVADPHFLETMLSYSEKYTSAGLLYCNSHIKTPNGHKGFATTSEETNFNFNTDAWNTDQLIKSSEAIRYFCKKNIILNVSSALIKKKCLMELPGEPLRMKYYGDWYCYICIAATTDVFYCCDLLNTFRRHPSSSIAQSRPNEVKVDCFRILRLLLKEQNVHQTETIDYFTKTYFSTGLKKEGIFSFLKTVLQFLFISPLLAARITAKIFQLKLSSKP